MLIKFCGLTRQEDVDQAVQLGAGMCGFIFHPRSPRGISPAQAAAMDSGTLRRVGVFVNQGADEIRRIMDEARLDYAQLHGHQSVECARAVGAVGRLYLGGEEQDIEVGYRAAEKAIEAISGREVKSK